MAKRALAFADIVPYVISMTHKIYNSIFVPNFVRLQTYHRHQGETEVLGVTVVWLSAIGE